MSATTKIQKFALKSIVCYKDYKLKIEKCDFSIVYDTFIYTCRPLVPGNGFPGQYSESLLKAAKLNVTDFLTDKELLRLYFINKELDNDTLTTIKEAIDSYYRRLLAEINQGNEQEGKPLIEEIK